ncbi:polar amino acid transport system substrate-binding protein [Streptomyces sp. TLI_235]|nr:ABC transporter substrate-binding protein [Streptomyces sp. TLI_235]PBC70264.1 polar amino acid transport system substrate-binding protein [Streptomyces sp. TLI_235]
MTPLSARGRAAATAALSSVLLLSACGAGGSGKNEADLHDQLPEAVQKAGVIRIGASLTAAPVVFRGSAGQPDGLDPDLAAAMAKVLGVKLEFQDVGPFSNVLPGLLDKKYDIAMSGITDNLNRRQGLDKNGKQINDGVDFVDYYMAGIGIMVGKGNPAKIAKVDDLCGHGVTVKKGTTHNDLAQRQKSVCDQLGKPLQVLETADDAAAMENLRAGRADAYVTDYPKALYNSQAVAGGQAFDIAGPQLQPKPYGIALRKSDSRLRDVLAKAMRRVVADGTYDEILTRRQLTVGAIQSPVVNGGTS